MIKYLKHIGDCILNGLFISLILFASVSVFDHKLTEDYQKSSQDYLISEVFDNNTDAVLTDAFLQDVNIDLFSNDRIDHQIKSTKKYILSNINTKIITAYKHSCKTHLSLRPILYKCSKYYMSSYHPEDYPSIS